MKLTSKSFENNQSIPAANAFAVPDAVNHVTLSDNRNPALEWSDIPEDTASLVLVCHDPDVPSKGDDVNKEGREVPADLPRVNFYHWVLVDLPATKTSIAEGEFSNGVTARGKDAIQGPDGTREGLNNYTDWFAGDPDMGGQYFGYDGPCPPWNDSILHHYVFTLYALDIAQCPLEGGFSGEQALDAICPHILDHASITGTYSLNPNIQK